jgi:hypothetical protein
MNVLAGDELDDNFAPTELLFFVERFFWVVGFRSYGAAFIVEG